MGILIKSKLKLFSKFLLNNSLTIFKWYIRTNLYLIVFYLKIKDLLTFNTVDMEHGKRTFNFILCILIVNFILCCFKFFPNIYR